MLGFSAKAFSSLRFPIKHQGQTTSDTTSMVTGAMVLAGSEVLISDMSKSFWSKPFWLTPSDLGVRSGGGNRPGRHPGQQRVHGVSGLQGRQGHRGTDAGPLAVGPQHGVLEHARQPSCRDVGVAELS